MCRFSFRDSTTGGLCLYVFELVLGHVFVMRVEGTFAIVLLSCTLTHICVSLRFLQKGRFFV